jgi:glycerophosphoryl diester phosphodiesterase
MSRHEQFRYVHQLLTDNPIIAHRGASAFAPENTLASFQTAYDLGNRMIEFDVMLSADGEAFVFHDDLLHRTTNSKGDLGQTRAADLQALDAGSWFSKSFRGEGIPTLRQVLSWCHAKGMRMNIEIKPYPGFAEQTALAVINEIARANLTHLPVISSFNLEALTVCQHHAIAIPRALLLSEWQLDWRQIADDLQCVSINISHRMASLSRIREIRQQGYAVCVYTVNRRGLAKRLFRWGVNAIFSDYAVYSRMPYF